MGLYLRLLRWHVSRLNHLLFLAVFLFHQLINRRFDGRHVGYFFTLQVNQRLNVDTKFNGKILLVDIDGATPNSNVRPSLDHFKSLRVDDVLERL